MALGLEDCLTAIETHTRGLADAARDNLSARVEHCPDWSVADLVHHLTEVHAFWNHVAATLPQDEPEAVPPVPRAPDEDLVASMLTGMRALLATLGAADQQSRCWTWGLDENVWFITRHQVQEAAVHHWDAANAAGREWTVDDDVATDAVDEFLTHSVANRRWPSPTAPPLGGTLWFCACSGDTDACPTWHVTDGEIPGTLTFETYPGRAPDITGPSEGDHVAPAELLLWLYRRIPDAALGSGSAGDRPLLERFRGFTNTA